MGGEPCQAGLKLWCRHSRSRFPTGIRSRRVESGMGFGFLGIGALYEVGHFYFEVDCRILYCRYLGIPKRIRSFVRRVLQHALEGISQTRSTCSVKSRLQKIGLFFSASTRRRQRVGVSPIRLPKSLWKLKEYGETVPRILGAGY